MKTIQATRGQRFLIGVLLLGLLLAPATGLVMAQGPGPQGGDTPQDHVSSAFTYQGRLKDASGLVSSTCDFEFRLFDAATSGFLIGPILTENNVTVSEGLFTVELDFGSGAYTGVALWLQIAVRCPAGSGSYATLSPRQPLTAAPYALSLRPGAIIRRADGPPGPALVLESYGRGLYVGEAADDGVYLYEVGAPSLRSGSGQKNGFEVAGAEGNGLYVGRADLDGVNVYSAGATGVRVASAGWDGVAVNSAPNASGVYVGAAKYGVYVNQTSSTGVYVNSAKWDGMAVISATASGVYVASAAGDGVNVYSAGDDGVFVNKAGNPSTTTPSDRKNGLEVAGAEGYGLYVGRADDDGVHVYEAGNPSSTISSGNNNGFQVNGAQFNGLFVGWTGWDGVYVASAGGDGVHVTSAADDGVYANTTALNNEWGVYTPDKIYAGTTLASGGPLMLVAQNGSSGNLETGDVVAVSGTGAVFAQGEAPAPLVQRAGQDSGAVMGVVYGRFVAEEKVEEVERDGKVEQQTSVHTHSTEGPVAPGDYLLVVVLGPAQVKAEAASSAGIRPGDLLTTAPGGQAAKATPVTVGEVTFYAPSTVIGKAMDALDKAQGSGLIWMLVMPR